MSIFSTFIEVIQGEFSQAFINGLDDRMETIIFYTELDKIIGCTHDKCINGEPFCDACQNNGAACSYKNKYMKEVQQSLQNERQLKASFIKLYLEKTLRIR